MQKVLDLSKGGFDMAKYRVHYWEYRVLDIDVEAESEAEAKEILSDRMSRGEIDTADDTDLAECGMEVVGKDEKEVAQCQ